MSIASEITRLTSAKAALKEAIEAKGVTVEASAKLDAFPALVESIPQGGGLSSGVYILYTDGTTSNYNVLDSGKTPVGVILINEHVSIVIHPSQSEVNSKKWSTDSNYAVIPGVKTVTTIADAILDYSGITNSAAVEGSDKGNSAFTFAKSAVYADGRIGYLPSAGELEQIRQNVGNVNTALGLISGTPFSFDSIFYWTSTQYNRSSAWLWNYTNSSFGAGYDKNTGLTCRSISAYRSI